MEFLASQRSWVQVLLCAVKLALFDLTGTGNIVVPNAEGNAKREFLIHVVAKRRGE